MYPIGVVSEMTGVNTVTLRAWERRYNLLTPHRTSTGRRVYSQADVDRIKSILTLMEKGIPIGQMQEALHMQQYSPETFIEPGNIWQHTLKNMQAAVADFDELRLEANYNEILSLYPIDLVVEKLLFPLLEHLGKRWRNRECDTAIAEEHFFGVYLRNKLGTRLHHRSPGKQDYCLLAACLPGEYHEVGLLLFTLAAQDHGYRVILLGANMPLEALPPAAKRCNAHAIVLSGSTLTDKKLLKKPLAELCQEVSVPVFVGGHLAAQCEKQLLKAGAIPAGNDIKSGLYKIDYHLQQEHP